MLPRPMMEPATDRTNSSLLPHWPRSSIFSSEAGSTSLKRLLRFGWAAFAPVRPTETDGEKLIQVGKKKNLIIIKECLPFITASPLQRLWGLRAFEDLYPEKLNVLVFNVAGKRSGGRGFVTLNSRLALHSLSLFPLHLPPLGCKVHRRPRLDS